MTATATEQPRTTDGTSDAPASALRFRCDPMQFKDADRETGVIPFRMMARSGDAIDHWYWGRIVHDMDGMQLRKSSCPVDWCHTETELIGFANQFDATDDGLQISGSLITTEPNDRADKVARQGKAGMPFEASIDWIGDGSELEYIPEGVSTEVNGKQFEGPGYVVRKWPLRAVAICPYGADAQSSTQFSDAPSGKVSVRVFSQPSEDLDVSKETPAKTDDKPQNTDEGKQMSESKTVATTAPGAITPDTLKQFNDAFGSKAMEYLTAGLSFDAARLQFADHRATEAEAKAKQLAEQLDEQKKQLTEAQDKLKQLADGNGVADPIDTDGKDDKKARLFSGGKANRKQG